MTGRIAKGIAIEGTDFIGKTTLAEKLVIRFARENPVHRKCFVSRSDLVGNLASAADSGSLEKRDWLLTAAHILDEAEVTELDCFSFAVQERCWFSQFARNMFFHDGKMADYGRVIYSQKRSFELQVYLYSDQATKRKRALSREPKGPRDALLLSSSSLHQAFDDCAVNLLPEDEQWHVIDTSGLTPNEVEEQVYDLFLANTSKLALRSITELGR
jgi:thymidylate kinase